MPAWSTGHNGVAWKCMKSCNFGYVIGSGIGVKHIESWNPQHPRFWNSMSTPVAFWIFYSVASPPRVFFIFFDLSFFPWFCFAFMENQHQIRSIMYMYIMFGFLFQASKRSQHLEALFFEWIDSCKAYSELFGLAGGLQAGKMMLRRGQLRWDEWLHQGGRWGWCVRVLFVVFCSDVTLWWILLHPS